MSNQAEEAVRLPLTEKLVGLARRAAADRDLFRLSRSTFAHYQAG